MQIRYRLTIQFILIAAGILLVSFFYVHFQFKKNLTDEFYDNLRSKALIIAEMVAGKKTDELEFEQTMPVENTSALSGDYPENISIYSLDGTRLYSFNPAPNRFSFSVLNIIGELGEYRFDEGNEKALGLIYTNRLGESYIVVAESIFDKVHLDNLLRILVVVFLIAITLVAIGGWFFARQALSPVSNIMNEVDAILPTDMSHRLVTSDQRDELSRLVITFNRLLDRIQNAFRIQKMFLSNISHELKNPLNVIISQVEVTLDKQRNNTEYENTLSSILCDAKELNDTADKLMQMARINSDNTTIQFEFCRIDEMIWQSKATLLKNHPEYKINFEIINLPEAEGNLFVMANEPLLKTAFVNLMDNGCKFSPGKEVKVSLAFAADERAVVEIMDKGPGIPEDELPMVFEAFYRSAKTSNIKGSGIGLTLVKSIAKLHHVDLSIQSKLEGGTTFILQFPIQQPHGSGVIRNKSAVI
ncbi:MAG: HAMP domain-containing histidine kinase [Bacteroidota bacterium]|nr:HAMP domain-containing histidine kinase [Bacteroidota bacterium]